MPERRSRRCSAASTSTSPRTAPCCTSRCGRRAARRSSSTARTSCPQVHEVLDRMARLRRAGAERRLARAHRRARSAHVVNIGIGGSDLGPAMAYRGARRVHRPRPRLPLRLERRRHRLRRGDARPRPCRDALRRLLEDVHDARDAHERPNRARLAARRARRRRDRGRAALRRRLHERRARSPSSASTRENMFGFWDWVGGRYSVRLRDRPVADGRHRARRASASCSAGFHAMDEHFRVGAARAQPARAARPARHLVHERSSAPRRSPCCRTTSTSRASRPTCSSSTWRATASASTLDGRPRRLRHGARSSGASRARTASTPSTSCIHQGTRLVAVRLHRLPAEPEPARRPSRPADREPLRAGRGARLRQHRRRGARRGRAGASTSRTARSRATARRTCCSPSGSRPPRSAR